eukprot:gene27584-34032_t
MATQLAAQLQAIQVGLPTRERDGQKASLLYEAREAADVDVETIYTIALNGFHELCNKDGRFQSFSKTLFSRSGVDYNRELKTKAQNEKLDTSVANFLRLLTNYFDQPEAFKVLELLVRRYRVHEYNVDALLAAALPFHSTNQFVRLVQIVQVQRYPLWEFLAPIHTSGAALPRATLVARCARDPALLNFICQSGKAAALDGSACKAAVTLYAIVVVEMLSRMQRPDDKVIADLLPFILDGFSHKASLEYQAGTIMITAQLLSSALLEEKVLTALLGAISRMHHAILIPQGLKLLFKLCRSQGLTTLPMNAFSHIAKWPELVQHLADSGGGEQ